MRMKFVHFLAECCDVCFVPIFWELPIYIYIYWKNSMTQALITIICSESRVETQKQPRLFTTEIKFKLSSIFHEILNLFRWRTTSSCLHSKRKKFFSTLLIHFQNRLNSETITGSCRFRVNWGCSQKTTDWSRTF